MYSYNAIWNNIFVMFILFNVYVTVRTDISDSSTTKNSYFKIFRLWLLGIIYSEHFINFRKTFFKKKLQTQKIGWFLVRIVQTIYSAACKIDFWRCVEIEKSCNSRPETEPEIRAHVECFNHFDIFIFKS